MDCSSSGVERKRWQTSEGGVLLLRELAAVCPEKADPFLEVMVNLLNCYENAEYGKLHNTIWKQVLLCGFKTSCIAYTLCICIEMYHYILIFII